MNRPPPAPNPPTKKVSWIPRLRKHTNDSKVPPMALKFWLYHQLQYNTDKPCCCSFSADLHDVDVLDPVDGPDLGVLLPDPPEGVQLQPEAVHASGQADKGLGHVLAVGHGLVEVDRLLEDQRDVDLAGVVQLPGGLPGCHLDSGQWIVDSGQWTLDIGQWTVDSGQWTVDSGQWTVDSGQWTVDSGQWTVDSGQWTVDS